MVVYRTHYAGLIDLWCYSDGFVNKECHRLLAKEVIDFLVLEGNDSENTEESFTLRSSLSSKYAFESEWDQINRSLECWNCAQRLSTKYFGLDC